MDGTVRSAFTRTPGSRVSLCARFVPRGWEHPATPSNMVAIPECELKRRIYPDTLAGTVTYPPIRVLLAPLLGRFVRRVNLQVFVAALARTPAWQIASLRNPRPCNSLQTGLRFVKQFEQACQHVTRSADGFASRH